jgi:hypothetical protein
MTSLHYIFVQMTLTCFLHLYTISEDMYCFHVQGELQQMVKWKTMCYKGSYEGIQPVSTSKEGREKTWLFVFSHWHFNFPKIPFTIHLNQFSHPEDKVQCSSKISKHSETHKMTPIWKPNAVKTWKLVHFGCQKNKCNRKWAQVWGN